MSIPVDQDIKHVFYNGTSIPLAGGSEPVQQYEHRIKAYGGKVGIMTTIINDDPTPFDKSALIDFFINHAEYPIVGAYYYSNREEMYIIIDISYARPVTTFDSHYILPSGNDASAGIKGTTSIGYKSNIFDTVNDTVTAL